MLMIRLISVSVIFLLSACENTVSSLEKTELLASESEELGLYGGVQFTSVSEGGQYENGLLLQVRVPDSTYYVVYSSDGYVLGISTNYALSYAIRYHFYQTGHRVIVARAFDSADVQLGEARVQVYIGEGQPAPQPQAQPVPPSTRAATAQSILGHHEAGRLTLWNQTFGRFDQADPLSNIRDTAAGQQAKTSCYGGSPCSTVSLQSGLLNAMKALRDRYGYSYFVTAISGARHSPNSYHYRGRAFDIDEIDGQRIYGDSPRARDFMNACWALGAVEVFGPSNDPNGHWDHLHCAF